MNFKEGIEFIGEDLLLKWYTPKEQLFSIGNPYISEDKSFLRWTNRDVFNGERVNVTAEFDSENLNNKLTYIRIECPEIEEKQNENSPWIIYDKYSELLKEEFGNATESREFHNRPYKKWDFGKYEIIVGVAERFMEYSIFVIKIKDT